MKSTVLSPGWLVGVDVCFIVFSLNATLASAGIDQSHEDRIFTSQFEPPFLYAYQFEQGNPARVAIIHTPSDTTAGLFVDGETRPALFMDSNNGNSEIQVGFDGLVASIIEAEQTAVFSNYNASTSTVTVAAFDSFGTPLLPETVVSISVDPLLALASAHERFRSSANNSERIAADFEYAGLLVSNGICELSGAAGLFSGIAGLQVPSPLIDCDSINPNELAYAIENPLAESLARSTDTIGCEPADDIQQCVPKLLDLLSTAAAVGIRSMSDAGAFARLAGPTATSTFDDVANNAEAPLVSGRVTFTEGHVTIDPANGDGSLPYSFWFPDYSGSEPRFLAAGWFFWPPNGLREPHVVFPFETNAMGFQFSSKFAGCEEVFSYAFYDQTKSLIAIYQQQGCFALEPATHFRGITLNADVHSAVIGGSSEGGTVSTGWLLDDFQFGIR